jgi:hypothetical protein
MDFGAVWDKHGHAMFKRSNLVLLSAVAVIFCGCKSVSVSNQNSANHFTGLTDFSNFDRLPVGGQETVLLSPKIKPPVDWNELVVSWNAAAPPGSYLKIEAQATVPGHHTKFYTLGLWSPDDRAFPRASVRGQKDPDGDVKVDTLVLNRLAGAVQIRLTLGGAGGGTPSLKFLGLSFCSTQPRPPPGRQTAPRGEKSFRRRNARNKVIPAATAGAARLRFRWCWRAGRKSSTVRK